MAREVLVWRFADGATEPERFTEIFAWRPAASFEALTLDPADLFRLGSAGSR